MMEEPTTPRLESPLRPPPEPWGARLKRIGILLGAVALAVAAYLAMPEDMNELARRTVAIFIIAAIFWASEVIPLYATSLCVIGLQILLLAAYGGLATPGLAPGDDLAFRDFLAPFASGVIVLFMGGFLLAAAVTKHGLDRAIAARILRPFTFHPLALLYALMGITAFFSMWMSNTATTAMMIALVLPLLKGAPAGERYNRAMVLAVPLGANIGGIGTPIGTPPNAVALAALRRAGYEISFLDWMMLAVPLAVVLMAIAGALLYLLLPPTRGAALPRIERGAPIDMLGKITLVILLCAMAGWITTGLHGVADAVIALIAAAALTALRVLDRSDVDSIDWNILLLMWGGLSLGVGMEATGLVDYIVALPIADLGGFAIAVVIVLVSVGLSTFMSNTAAANLIIPMAMGLAVARPEQLVVLTALACSFAMALPISTPPNAIAFASGQLTSGVLLRVGGIISIICILALLLGYQVMIPLLFQ